jgi:DNA-formamidopyrimidine glycosylase
MAEGHLVARWAQRLRSLIGQPLEVVELPARWEDRASGLVGQHLTDVSTHGKHLLLRLPGGDTIHCHAMMFGSWQVGKPGMSLRKPADRVRLRLRTRWQEAVFFNGPVVELLTPAELASHRRLQSLGPDILTPEFDRNEVWRRLRAEPNREIAETIIDQTVVAGIGNIYKSEGLFLAGIDPRAAVGSLDREQIEGLWDILIPLMQKGVRAMRMRTRPKPSGGKDHRHWVYQRRGQSCFRCGAKIVRIVQGRVRRTTFFCPRCQQESGFRLM